MVQVSFENSLVKVERLIPVLFSDNRFVVFNKPSGLLTIPTFKNERNTLEYLVNRAIRLADAGEKKSPLEDLHLYPCHRLDRETSGVIVFARGRKNQEWMMMAFKQRRVQKKYIALVQGRLKHPAGEIKSLIKDVHHRLSEDDPGKFAITRYKVLKLKNDFSILEVFPLTGRTNQIRIHLAELGHPLIGERQYSFGRDFPLKFRRVALHSAELAWTDSNTHQMNTVTAPMPKDLEEFIRQH